MMTLVILSKETASSHGDRSFVLMKLGYGYLKETVSKGRKKRMKKKNPVALRRKTFVIHK